MLVLKGAYTDAGDDDIFTIENFKFKDDAFHTLDTDSRSREIVSKILDVFYRTLSWTVEYDLIPIHTDQLHILGIGPDSHPSVQGPAEQIHPSAIPSPAARVQTREDATRRNPLQTPLGAQRVQKAFKTGLHLF